MRKNNVEKKSDTKEEKTKDMINEIKDDKVFHHKKTKVNYKLIICIILFIIFFTICLFFASRTVDRKKSFPINYTQIGNIDYKVYLNKNEFYNDEYLSMNKSYIASLINYIDVDFNYEFNIEKKISMDFDYKIIGELVIENSKGTGRYLEKEYTLLDTKVKKLVEDDKMNIKENIKIDYAYYNSLANSFKSTYGVDINSYLNVYLEISPKTDKNSRYKINESNKISLAIPLSEKAIEIKLNATNQRIVKQIVSEGEIVFNQKYLILEIVFLIPSCILLIFIVKRLIVILDIYTPYDKYTKKTLKEYDRLIVETNSKIKLKDFNVIEVKNFTELLDARDNLNLPILYLNTIPHHEGMFYIMNNKDVYLLIINDEYLNRK